MPVICRSCRRPRGARQPDVNLGVEHFLVAVLGQAHRQVRSHGYCLQDKVCSDARTCLLPSVSDYMCSLWTDIVNQFMGEYEVRSLATYARCPSPECEAPDSRRIQGRSTAGKRDAHALVCMRLRLEVGCQCSNGYSRT